VIAYAAAPALIFDHPHRPLEKTAPKIAAIDSCA
jgi:hypothetical protein